ncbi:methyltransferase domain-containing protein [Thiohalocapsa sp. ML1]|jgi:hypothetical protein|uniref:methyltransferase domain-containing protein n=1 Tax=Thiohalocapsa sp. ML1 TaxID=1431688 RepID=UPI0009EB85C0|nr:methyltransferase domain-containing protein [Thiohalocapsa sp. ML1]
MTENNQRALPNGPRGGSGGTGSRTSSRSIAALRFELRWQSDEVRHCDSLCLPNVDLSLAELPQRMKSDLMNQPVGHCATWRFRPGQLIPDHHPARLLLLGTDRFNLRSLGRGPVEPRRGRFYPKSVLKDAQDLFASDRSPWRVTDIQGERFLADLNHPLAGKELQVTGRITRVLDVAERRRGPGVPVRTLLTDDGPGMQGRWRGHATEFLTSAAIERMDDDDPGFYARLRLVDHLDSMALSQISALYGRLIPRRSRVLDLMSSWHSHLPASLAAERVVGLGMNAQEMAQNPALDDAVVHDLNADPRLPFDDAAFEAIVCTVSVEYLIQPFAVFRELARVLSPGGIAVMTFSNRWFPTKAIRIWEELHEFERPGLVLEYFRESGCFRDLHTSSLRGLPRPADDKYAHRLAQSDPVHAVWARRLGEPRIRL